MAVGDIGFNVLHPEIDSGGRCALDIGQLALEAQLVQGHEGDLQQFSCFAAGDQGCHTQNPFFL